MGKGSQAGFSIVEAMVTVMIAAVGMLSVAAGQVSNMKYTSNSFDYTMAVLEANNAIEVVWVNLCRLQKNPSLFEGMKPTTQNKQYTISYPEGFTMPNFRVVVEWSDDRITNNLANRAEIFVKMPDITKNCKP